MSYEFNLHFFASHFENSQMIRSWSEDMHSVCSKAKMVSAHYLVKELMDLDHILHTY